VQNHPLEPAAGDFRPAARLRRPRAAVARRWIAPCNGLCGVSPPPPWPRSAADRRAGAGRGLTFTWALLLAFALLSPLSGCGGPGVIRIEQGTCTIDGASADLARVEERESQVQHRIVSRQPWLVAITVVVVSLAGISYIERLVMLFSATRDAKGMGDRVRELVERYRAHRVRYVAMVAGSVSVLIGAGVFYIYLDADKRASERALATLQFCHLSLRTADEKRALDEQRSNLSSIHDTAGEIRGLIAKLPPDERAKAHQIIGHMDEAVGKQGRLITERLQRSEDAAEALRGRTQSIERGVSGLQSGLDGLKPLPLTVHALSDLVAHLDGRAAATESRLAADDDKLQAIQRSLDTLVNRPAPVCPACVCEPPRTAALAEAVTHAKTTTTADPSPAAAPAPPAHAAATSEAPKGAPHADVGQVPSSSTR
jgi:hypothetical protein